MNPEMQGMEAMANGPLFGPDGAQAVQGAVDPADDRELFKLLDIKGLAKLVPFTGSEDDWNSWHFRTKAAAPLIGLHELIQLAEQLPEPDEQNFTPDQRRRSLLLWSLLSQLVGGIAYTILRMVPYGHGAQAWHKIYFEYEAPDQVLRQMTILVGLLEPRWGNDVASFEDKWLKWELQIEELAATTNIRIQDHVRAAVLLTKSPRPIRRFLEQQAMNVQASYQNLRTALRMYLAKMKSYDREGRVRVEPMEVDVLGDSAETSGPTLAELLDDVDTDDEVLAVLRDHLRTRRNFPTTAAGASSSSNQPPQATATVPTDSVPKYGKKQWKHKPKSKAKSSNKPKSDGDAKMPQAKKKFEGVCF